MESRSLGLILAKLRDYFGKDNIHIEYQVKSKAAKAAEPVRPQPVASPPVDMTIDDALDSYQSEVSSIFVISKNLMSLFDDTAVSKQLKCVLSWSIPLYRLILAVLYAQ